MQMHCEKIADYGYEEQTGVKQQYYLLLLAILWTEQGFTPKTGKIEEEEMIRCMTVFKVWQERV